jgi:mannose-6-phosphate isomerase-like protein (cupin superfamily)
MKFCLKDALKFGWDGLEGYAYNSKEDFSRASAAYFKVTKKHGKVKNIESDRIYYIIEGNGQFIIENITYDVKESDVIIVPKNTEYDYRNDQN